MSNFFEGLLYHTQTHIKEHCAIVCPNKAVMLIMEISNISGNCSLFISARYFKRSKKIVSHVPINYCKTD